MSRLALLSFLMYGLILFGLATFRSEIVALALPLAVFLLAGLASSTQTPRLSVTRQVGMLRASPGVPINVTLSLTNEGEVIEQISMQDQLPEGLEKLSGETSLLASLGPGESRKVSYVVQAQRGAYYFQDVKLTTGDRLGLINRTLTFNPGGMIAVLPPVMRLPRIPIQPQQTRGFIGLIPARQGGPGVTFHGIREYQPGDALRWVNWRASARHPQALYSNEFQQERAADVDLVLDARQESYLVFGNDSLFEYAILAAASLAQSFLSEGNRVGLVHYGQFIYWTFPGYGKIQRERILHALAQARIGESEVNHLEYLPTRFFTPGSQIILISPLLKKDQGVLVNMRAKGYAVMVISPDPVAFEARWLPKTSATEMATRIAHLERTLLLRQLRQSGVRVLNWDVLQPFDQAVAPISHGAARFVERHL